MQNNEIFLFVNPEFDKRFSYGMSKLYNIFCIKNNFILRIIDKNFLTNHIPGNQYKEKLVIVGGDGTIHIAINSIPDDYMDRYLFGFIPAGTANEFSKLFSIPNDITQAANIIINIKNLKEEKIGIINNNIKFVTGILYGIESEILKYTPTLFKHAYGIDAFLIGNFLYYLSLLRLKSNQPELLNRQI